MNRTRRGKGETRERREEKKGEEGRRVEKKGEVLELEKSTSPEILIEISISYFYTLIR